MIKLSLTTFKSTQILRDFSFSHFAVTSLKSREDQVVNKAERGNSCFEAKSDIFLRPHHNYNDYAILKKRESSPRADYWLTFGGVRLLGEEVSEHVYLSSNLALEKESCVRALPQRQTAR